MNNLFYVLYGRVKNILSYVLQGKIINYLSQVWYANRGGRAF
jgi:hypothetical protein